jgi:DNA-binding CsgD family transcriptional regulator
MSTVTGIDTPSTGRFKVLEGMVRSLIDHCERRPPAALASATQNVAVMLDIHVEGVRCLLVRSRAVRNNLLSPRELEIVRLAAQGHPNKVIAGMLNISTWTVGTHIRHIFAKLGVTSRAAMVAKVLEVSLAEAFGNKLDHWPSLKGSRVEVMGNCEAG